MQLRLPGFDPDLQERCRECNHGQVICRFFCGGRIAWVFSRHLVRVNEETAGLARITLIGIATG